MSEDHKQKLFPLSKPFFGILADLVPYIVTFDNERRLQTENHCNYKANFVIKAILVSLASSDVKFGYEQRPQTKIGCNFEIVMAIFSI